MTIFCQVESWFQRVIRDRIHWKYQNLSILELWKSISFLPPSVVSEVCIVSTTVQTILGAGKKFDFWGFSMYRFALLKKILHHCTQRTYFHRFTDRFACKYFLHLCYKTYLVARSNSLRRYCSVTSLDRPVKNSATCFAGNSDSQT